MRLDDSAPREGGQSRRAPDTRPGNTRPARPQREEKPAGAMALAFAKLKR
jgi:hypothetical protein